MRVALIGCGDVAEAGHVPTMLRHAKFQITAVCDVRGERAELLALRAGSAAAFTDWRVMLDSGKFDAVVIAVPPEHSADIAIECLERGLAVLDEKPLAATIEDGRRVARVVAEWKGVYQVGFVFRYGDWIREIARRADAIGRPLHTRVGIYDEKLDRSDREHFERITGFLRTSSAITHEGSHVVDYAWLWSPSPWAQISATARRTEPDFPGPNVWNAKIEQADGSMIEIDVGWLLPQIPPRTISVHGRRGWIKIDPAKGEMRWQVDGDSGSMTVAPVQQEWERQYDTFAQAIERGVVSGATVEDGLRALEVTAACEEAARSGRKVLKRGSGGNNERPVGE